MPKEIGILRTTDPVGLNDIDFEHTSFIDVQFESAKKVLPESENMEEQDSVEHLLAEHSSENQS